MSAATQLEQALRSWPKGQRHTQIMTVANLAAMAGIPQGEAVARITAAMPRPPNPRNEVEAAVEKAFAESATLDTTAMNEAFGWDASIGGNERAIPAPPAPVAVSFYASKTDRTGAQMPLETILAGIRDGRWAAVVEPVRTAIDDAAKDAAKGRLPGFTPGGTFTVRRKDGLLSHSGLIVADIDGLQTEAEAAKVRDTLARDAHVQAAFISPSGRGVKALLRVEPCADAADHEAAFAALVARVSSRYSIDLDTSGRDVSRLCFVSHDPGAFVRTGKALPFMWRGGATVEASTEPTDTAAPYTTRAWDELDKMQLTPPMEMWGGLVLGALGVIFGQGGLGKSRLALNIARNQALGLPFAGLPTAARPLRHLMMGSENSIHRLQYDVRRMSGGLTPEQVATLGAHIRLATLEGPEDTFISMNDTNASRWQATLEAWPPDVLYVDPWGDVLDGESNNDEDARATISSLRRILRRVNPEAAVCILAHSRTGASNILQAVGYDAANFGKGSKALYSAARCVWNLAPGDESEHPPLVCVHAKSNDSRKNEPIAVRLDEETMTYHVADGFDFDQWQADLSAAARGKRGPKKGVALSEESAMEALGDTVGTSAEVKQTLREKGANKDIAEDLVKRLVLDGRWEQWRPPALHAPTYIGTPEGIRRKRTEVTESLQKKLTV